MAVSGLLSAFMRKALTDEVVAPSICHDRLDDLNAPVDFTLVANLLLPVVGHQKARVLVLDTLEQFGERSGIKDVGGCEGAAESFQLLGRRTGCVARDGDDLPSFATLDQVLARGKALVASRAEDHHLRHD